MEAPKDCQSYHPFDFHKTTNHEEDPWKEEDSPEDSLEEEDSPEGEDSPEEEDTQVEEEYHLEDRQEVVGDCHCCPCNKPNKGN